MMTKIFLSVILMLTAGCASTLRICPNKSPEQTSSFNAGVETLLSRKQAILSIGSPSEKISSKDRLTLYVLVKNTTNNTFDFSTENITALCDGKPVKVFTYGELKEEIESKRRSRAFAAGLAAFSNSLNASSTTSYRGTIHSQDGNVTTFSGQASDPTAQTRTQIVANAQLRTDLDSINENASLSAKSLNESMLKKQTVFPGQLYGGAIELAPLDFDTDNTDLIVRIAVLNDQHQFRFSVIKNGNKDLTAANKTKSSDLASNVSADYKNTTRETKNTKKTGIILDPPNTFYVEPIDISSRFGIPFAALAYTGKGFEYSEKQEYGIAKRYWERVIEVREHAPSSAREAASLVAFMYELKLHDYETAIHYYTIAIDIAEDVIKEAQQGSNPYFPDDIVYAYVWRQLFFPSATIIIPGSALASKAAFCKVGETEGARRATGVSPAGRYLHNASILYVRPASIVSRRPFCRLSTDVFIRLSP